MRFENRKDLDREHKAIRFFVDIFGRYWDWINKNARLGHDFQYHTPEVYRDISTIPTSEV